VWLPLWPAGKNGREGGIRLLLRQWIPWVCFLTGVLLLYIGQQQLSSSEKTEGWVQAEGRILSASVEEAASPNGRPSYLPLILYEFHVGTIVQHGSRVGLGVRGFSAKRDAQAVVDRYQPGHAVEIYYNPGLPSESVLERPSPARSYALTGSGILCLLLGPAVSILQGRRKRGK
jgi:hypothetical protein